MSHNDQNGQPVGFRICGRTGKSGVRRLLQRMQNSSQHQTNLLYKVEGLGIIQRSSLNQSQALLSDSINLMHLQVQQLKEMHEKDEQTNIKLKELSEELERQETDNSYLKEYFNDLNSGILRYEYEKHSSEISLVKFVPEIVLNRSIAEGNLVNAKKCLKHLENMLKVRKIRYMDKPAALPITLIKKATKRTKSKNPKKYSLDIDLIKDCRPNTKRIINDFYGNRNFRPSGPYKVPSWPYNNKNKVNLMEKPKELDDKNVPLSGDGIISSERKKMAYSKVPVERQQQNQPDIFLVSFSKIKDKVETPPRIWKPETRETPNEKSVRTEIKNSNKYEAQSQENLETNLPQEQKALNKEPTFEPRNLQDHELSGENKKANKYIKTKFLKKSKRTKRTHTNERKENSQQNIETGNFLTTKYGSIGQVLLINTERKKRNKRQTKSRLKKYLRRSLASKRKIPLPNNFYKTKEYQLSPKSDERLVPAISTENNFKAKSTVDFHENLDDKTKVESMEQFINEPKFKTSFSDTTRPSSSSTDVSKKQTIDSTATEIINLLFEDKAASMPPPSHNLRKFSRINASNMSINSTFFGTNPATHAEEVWTDLVAKYTQWTGKFQNPNDADIVRTMLKERYIHNVQKILHSRVKEIKLEMNPLNAKSFKTRTSDAKDNGKRLLSIRPSSNNSMKAATKSNLSSRKHSTLGPEFLHYLLLSRQTQMLRSSILDEDLEDMREMLISKQVPESGVDIQLFKKYDSDPNHYNILIMALDMDTDQTDKDFGENVRLLEHNYEFIKRNMEAAARRKIITDMAIRSQELRKVERDESKMSFRKVEPGTIVFDNDYMTQLREQWAAYFAQQAKTPMEIQLAKVRRQRRREEAKKRAETRRHEKKQEKATRAYKRSPSALFRRPRQTNRLRKALKDIHEEQTDQESPCKTNSSCKCSIA